MAEGAASPESPESAERPVDSLSEMAFSIAEALRRAGVSAHVAIDGAPAQAVVISDVPRGRRPTIVRVMAMFPCRWRFGLPRS